MKKMLVTVVLATLCAGVRAEDGGFSGLFDGGWRLSAGGVWDFGLKAHARFLPPATYVSPFSPGAMTKEAARLAAAGARTSATRTDFPGGAWVDTDDPVYAGGDDVGRTRYYRVPASSYAGDGRFSLARARAIDHLNNVIRKFKDK